MLVNTFFCLPTSGDETPQRLNCMSSGKTQIAPRTSTWLGFADWRSRSASFCLPSEAEIQHGPVRISCREIQTALSTSTTFATDHAGQNRFVSADIGRWTAAKAHPRTFAKDIDCPAHLHYFRLCQSATPVADTVSDVFVLFPEPLQQPLVLQVQVFRPHQHWSICLQTDVFPRTLRTNIF